MTLIDPVVVSVLREFGEDAACAEIEGQYQRFMHLSTDHEAAAHFSWITGAAPAHGIVTTLIPKVRLEMTATRSDTATLAWLAESPPPTTILVGEKTLVAPRAVARLLGHALEATTIVVPGAAHMIPMTHPQAVVDAVRRKATDPARADAIAADGCFSSPVGFRTARPLSGMLLSFATNRRLISVLPA